MIDIVERLKDAENATHALFNYIFQDARDEIERLRAKIAEIEEPAPSVPTVATAAAMGAKGGPALEGERLAFEAWVRGHGWSLCARWNGEGYVGDLEQGGAVCPHAMRTRMMWAAWRDRAALAHLPMLD